MAGGAIYHADWGPDRPIRWAEVPGCIGVFDADGRLVGEAHPAAIGEGGLALWRLVVRKAEIPGRFVLRGRRFERAGDVL